MASTPDNNKKFLQKLINRGVAAAIFLTPGVLDAIPAINSTGAVGERPPLTEAERFLATSYYVEVETPSGLIGNVSLEVRPTETGANLTLSGITSEEISKHTWVVFRSTFSTQGMEQFVGKQVSLQMFDADGKPIPNGSVIIDSDWQGDYLAKNPQKTDDTHPWRKIENGIVDFTLRANPEHNNASQVHLLLGWNQQEGFYPTEPLAYVTGSVCFRSEDPANRGDCDGRVITFVNPEGNYEFKGQRYPISPVITGSGFFNGKLPISDSSIAGSHVVNFGEHTVLAIFEDPGSDPSDILQATKIYTIGTEGWKVVNSENPLQTNGENQLGNAVSTMTWQMYTIVNESGLREAKPHHPYVGKTFKLQSDSGQELPVTWTRDAQLYLDGSALDVNTTNERFSGEIKITDGNYSWTDLPVGFEIAISYFVDGAILIDTYTADESGSLSFEVNSPDGKGFTIASVTTPRPTQENNLFMPFAATEATP